MCLPPNTYAKDICQIRHVTQVFCSVFTHWDCYLIQQISHIQNGLQMLNVSVFRGVLGDQRLANEVSIIYAHVEKTSHQLGVSISHVYDSCF